MLGVVTLRFKTVRKVVTRRLHNKNILLPVKRNVFKIRVVRQQGRAERVMMPSNCMAVWTVLKI
jgi:hypothetical protein